jgi:hypothetical protein
LFSTPTGAVVLTGSGKLFGCIRRTRADARPHETCGTHFFGDVGTFAFRAVDLTFFSGKDQFLKLFFTMVTLIFKNRHMGFLKFTGLWSLLYQVCVPGARQLTDIQFFGIDVGIII